MQELEVFNTTDLDFHYAVVKTAQNNILVVVYNALSNLMLESRRKTTQIPGVAEENLKGHQSVFLTIKLSNEKLVHRSMFIHIDTTEQNILKIFK